MAESAPGWQRQAQPGGMGGAGDGPGTYGRGHNHGPRAVLGGYLSLVSVSGRRPPPNASLRRLRSGRGLGLPHHRTYEEERHGYDIVWQGVGGGTPGGKSFQSTA